MLKCLLLHVTLVLVIVLYVVVGAAVFLLLDRVDSVDSRQNTTVSNTTAEQYKGGKRSFGDFVLFTLSVVTSVGYGIAPPQSVPSRLFLIVYSLFGIPFTLTALASIGKHFTTPLLTFVGNLVKPNDVGRPFKVAVARALTLLVVILIYILYGALIMPVYEKSMDVWEAYYFNFVTLSTLGFADLVDMPKWKGAFMVFTCVYIIVGIALVASAIPLATYFFKKIHWFKRNVHESHKTTVWIGAERVSLGTFALIVGKQFSVTEAQMRLTDFDAMCYEAIERERIGGLSQVFDDYPPSPIRSIQMNEFGSQSSSCGNTNEREMLTSVIEEEPDEPRQKFTFESPEILVEANVEAAPGAAMGNEQPPPPDVVVANGSLPQLATESS